MARTELDELAVNLVGDGNSPNLFFISRNNEDGQTATVITVTHDYNVAYSAWKMLATRCPSLCPTLEDREHGTIASIDRDEETGRLVEHNDCNAFGFYI